MLDIALTEEKQLKNKCKQILDSIDSQQINELSLELFPIKTTSDTIELLFKNMSSFYELKLEKNIGFDDITNQILKKTKDKNKKLYEAFDHLLKSQFMQKFKKRILKAKGLIQKSNITKSSQQIQITDNTQRKVIAFGPSSEETKSSGQPSKEIFKTNSVKEIRSISSDSASQKKITTTPLLKDFKRPPLKLAVNSTVQNQNNNVITESGVVANLSDQVMCFCGKHVSLIEKIKESSFQCHYCKKSYHRECMKRTESSKTCTYCHLKRLIPNREVKRILFVGLLHQGRKKHQIVLNLSEEDMSIQFKIQVRCFRIKEGCQNFILFPDACNFSIRNLVLKEFVPLHRQSSLKYRKDQPFYLSAGMHVKQNKIVVTQKHPGKQSKDQRIVLGSHLIGIYIIEQKKVDWLIRQMRMKSFSTFTESKDLLELGFKRGNIGDQISCQIIKIPLTCSLSTQKLNIPARGLFCTHFQCFDLKNFLQLIAGSTNPRWLCPLCKIPAFQFRIDIILHSILQLYKTMGEASQIVFNRNGHFKVFSKDDKECISSVHSIHDLPIQNKLKREDPVKMGEQDVLIKKSKIM